MDKISLSEPIVGDEEKRALCEVIDSGWLTMGEHVAAFEKSFAKMHRVNDAVALSSCTAALHLALNAFGVGLNDEVLVPSLTFVATVNAVLYVGASPVFVDIESLNRPHISIEDAKSKITGKTKAVIVMHYGGYVADMPAWRLFSDVHGLKLIEDAAHAPGVGQVGHFSDSAVFSFFSNKNLSTAEGGMLIAGDESVIEKVRRLRAHGMTTDTLVRHRGHAYSYDVNMLGFNYRMDELRAAMGLVQISHLPRWNEKRRFLSNLYRQEISNKLPEIIIPFESSYETAAHLMPVLLPNDSNRIKVMEKLRLKGIQSSIHYPPIHQFSYLKDKHSQIKLDKTEEFCKRELSLPLYPTLKEADIEHITLELKNSFL